jgi:hypothetical protein
VAAADEAHSAVADSLHRIDAEKLTLLVRRRLVSAIDALGDDAGRRGQPVGGAPAVKGQRSAVVAQKFGIQGLEERERFQARGEALLPRGRAAAFGASGARKERERERRERFAGAKFHRRSRWLETCT